MTERKPVSRFTARGDTRRPGHVYVPACIVQAVLRPNAAGIVVPRRNGAVIIAYDDDAVGAAHFAARSRAVRTADSTPGS